MQRRYFKISDKNKGKKYSSTPPEADKTINATTANEKCNCPVCMDSRYEPFNKADEDSIYYPPFEELKGGKIYVSLDAISDTEKEEFYKRFGKFNKEVDDN